MSICTQIASIKRRNVLDSPLTKELKTRSSRLKGPTQGAFYPCKTCQRPRHSTVIRHLTRVMRGKMLMDRMNKSIHWLSLTVFAMWSASPGCRLAASNVPLSMLAPPLISSFSHRSPCRAPARISSRAMYSGSWNLSFSRDATIALYNASPIGVC